MNVPDIHIYLCENAIPCRISTPRHAPLRFQEEAEKTILKLLEAGVIVRVEGPKPWCAPAFFGPKAYGIKVRMVTDFTKINKFVISQFILFPPSRTLSSVYQLRQLTLQKRTQYTAIFNWLLLRNHPDFLSSSFGPLQILKGSNGTQFIIGCMVSPFRYSSGRVTIRLEDCG